MDDTARWAGPGPWFRHRGRTMVLPLTLLGLVTAPAPAQQDDEASRDAALEEIGRLFGAQSKAAAAVERLGGKVKYDTRDPRKREVSVDFSHARLTDSDLGPLKDPLKAVPRLVLLDLSGTEVGDSGLAHLHDLTALNRLNVAQTRVMDVGVAGLLRALPQVHVSRRPRPLKFFPDGMIGPDDGGFLADWYSENLYAMGEPSLWALPREDRKAVAYRFLWTPSFRSPVAVRIVASGEGAVLHAVKLDGGSGYRGGKPASRKSVKLTRDQWADVRRRLDDARFWSLPHELRTNGIADGASYVVEGVEGGKYHVVHANTNPRPDDRYSRYKALCEEMIKLSGLDVMDLWKTY